MAFNASVWALRNTALVRYFMVLLLLIGTWSYFQLGQNEDPEFTFRVMVVRANLPGATALQVEQQLTDKLERKLQETPYLDKLRSYSKPGESLVFVSLKGSVPPKEVNNIWYQVRKKVGDIKGNLPAGTEGPFFNDEFGDTYGSIFAFSADGYSYAELKDWVDRARQELLRVPHVSKVELFGVQDEAVYIVFSHQKFARMGVTFQQVLDALAQQNAIQGSGVMAAGEWNIPMRVSGQFSNLSEIENLMLRVEGVNGPRSFRLGDFATVSRETVTPPVSKMRFNGREVIGVGISMDKGGNIIQLGRDLDKSFANIRSWLPVGIEMQQVADQPRVVNKSVGEFLHTLIEAIVIVLTVSFLALGLHRRPLRLDVRPGLVVALSIPLVLAITFFCMWVWGIDLQKISLGALIIALGLLVDDAIIAVEMMVRKLEEGYDKFTAASAMYSATAAPMLTGTLITVAGFMPVGFAKSAAGEYTFSIFAVNAVALLTSWLVAVVFTPYLGVLLLKERPSHTGQPHEVFDSPAYQRFRTLVDYCVEHRKLVIAITLGAFVLSIVGFRFVQQQFFPNSNREELIVDLWLPEGSSYAATEAQTRKFEAFLQRPENAKDVTNYVSWVAAGSPRFYLPLDQQFNHTNFAQIIIRAKDVEARNRLRDRGRELFKNDFPDVRGRIYPLQAGPPVAYPVQFRVTGPEHTKVQAYARQVADVMKTDADTVGINNNWNEPIRVLRLDLDQDKARALGVPSAVLAKAGQVLLSGFKAGTYRDGDKSIDIIIRQPEDERTVMSRLMDANIHTVTGQAVPLSQLAHLSMGWEPGIIWRLGREPSITVQSDVRDGVQGPFVAARLWPQMAKLQAQMEPGYRLEIAGATEESATAQASINANMPVLILIILTLLMLQLRSFSRTVLVFLTAPLGLIGAAMTLLAFQAPFGFVATLGVIALAGMIMRNSVILVDQIERDIAAGRPRWESVVEAAVRRFRPIMLTAAAAILAMIPLTRSIFWGPMAVAIMGGLLVATVLTLLFLPALYAAWFRVRRNEAPPQSETDVTAPVG